MSLEKPKRPRKNLAQKESATCLPTYLAECRKISAVHSHNSIGIERKENVNKN